MACNTQSTGRAVAIVLAAVSVGGWLVWNGVHADPTRQARQSEQQVAEPSEGGGRGISNPVHAMQGIDTQYVLTPERCSALGGCSGQEFDVEPNGAVVIGNPSGLMEVITNADGIQADLLTQHVPDSFSLDGQGTILGVSGQYFGELENGEFSKAVPLPYGEMQLMGSSLRGVAYILSRTEPASHRVYAFFADGTLQIEAELPEGIVGVTDNRSAVYLASEHNLFRLTSSSIEIVARLPEHLGKIVSIAVAPDDHALYFATDKETFVLSGLSAVALLQDLGGTIHIRHNKLYAWSPDRQVLVSLSGLRGALQGGN